MKTREPKKVVIAIDDITVFSGYVNDEEYKKFLMTDPNPQQLLYVQGKVNKDVRK